MTSAARRAAAIESVIPTPPADVAPLRIAFSRMVARRWDVHVSTRTVSPKARFIAQMYARACYSMLLVSAPLRFPPQLPLSRAGAISGGSALLTSLNWLAPQSLHRRLMLMSTLMGMLDVVLDDAASSGKAAVLRIASLLDPEPPAGLSPAEQSIATLARTLRPLENDRQAEYWDTVLRPAVRAYCLAESLAVAHVPDPTGMGHRGAGIDAAIKGMWYVIDPRTKQREKQWMADTSLLMQMIDDWVDQDDDRGARLTPVVAGDWSLQTVDELYRKTVCDLGAMLAENRIHHAVLQQLFIDLYTDYLHTALDAMRTGVAA